MEPLQVVQRRLCHRVRAQTLAQTFQSGYASTNLHYQPSRLKASLTRPSQRAFSTAPARFKSGSSTVPLPPDSPSASKSQSSDKPTPQRDSWAQWIAKPRPHGTTPPDTKPNSMNFSRVSGATSSILDMVEPSPNLATSQARAAYSPLPSPTSRVPVTNPQSMTARIGNDLREMESQTTHDALESVHLRLSPMLGRTMAVDPATNRDLQTVLRVLEARCTQNRVKSDSIAQRTHIRKGLAKKRLSSARWRALFMAGFVKEVARVRKMRRQGW